MKLSILAATLAATVFCSAADAAQTVRIEDCGKKTDAVVFMVDASGSMMQTVGEIKKKARKQHETLSTSDQGTAQADSAQPPNAEIDDSSRVRLAKEVISKIASQLPPESGIELSLYTIAPYAELVPPAQRTTEEFVRTANERLSTNLEVFGRPTWMGKRAYGKFSAKVDGIERILPAVFLTELPAFFFIIQFQKLSGIHRVKYEMKVFLLYKRCSTGRILQKESIKKSM